MVRDVESAAGVDAVMPTISGAMRFSAANVRRVSDPKDPTDAPEPEDAPFEADEEQENKR